MAQRKVLTVNLGAKQPYEVLNWKVKFRRSLLAGQTINTIESAEVVRLVTAEVPPDLEITGGSIPSPALVDEGTAIVFWTAGGNAGAVYKITFQLADSETPLRLELDCTLAVSSA